MIKTIFFSTSDRMVRLLDKINQISDLQLCVTKEDVKVGRKQEIKENEVKKWCIENNKKFIQISNLKDKNLETVLHIMSDIKPDLCIVVDFNFIIPQIILSEMNNKMINIHYSLLPKYRGASPIQFAILKGDTKTGITYQFIDKEMDKGNILMQETYSLKGTETSEYLFEQLLELNINSMSKFIELYSKNELDNKIQNEHDASYTYSKTQPNKTIIFKEDAYVDFTEEPLHIEKMIRAYNPKPIVWTHLKHLVKYKNLALKDSSKQELIVKLYEATLSEESLNIIKLQIEGKNIMSWNEFVNGYTVK